MGIPWKKIGKGIIAGATIGAAVAPGPFGKVLPLITLAKKLTNDEAAVVPAVMEAIEDEIDELPESARDEARTLYASAVTLVQKADAAYDQARDAIQKTEQFIATVKAA